MSYLLILLKMYFVFIGCLCRRTTEFETVRFTVSRSRQRVDVTQKCGGGIINIYSGFPCVGVALSSNQGNSPLRSKNTGFHFALTSAKLPALRSVETPTPNPCEVRESSLFLEVTFAISNHRITYNSMLATSQKQRFSRKDFPGKSLVKT